MKVKEIYAKLCEIYPEESSCSWDNDGLTYSAGNREVEKVLISLDCNLSAVEYAIENGFSLILHHHPLIFHPFTDLESKVAEKLIKNDIASISLHTRLDGGEGGVNDILAGILSLKNVYRFGEDGMGRIGELEEEIDPDEFAAVLKEKLGCRIVEYTKGDGRKIKKVAVLGGSGADFFPAAVAEGADAFVTGEVKYNFYADYSPFPTALFVCGHYQTEHPVTARLSEIISSLGTENEIISTLDYYYL